MFAGLAACENIAASSGIAYNEGLAESYNSVLLMNIIRSAKNYPLYYSAIGDLSADYSTDLDFSPSVDIPFQFGAGALIDGDVDVSLSPSASVSRDINANATSLETEKFIAAINTTLPPQTLLFFTEGRDRGSLSLILMVLVDRLTVTQQEFQLTLRIAHNNCQEQKHKLSVQETGICQSLLSYSVPKSCSQHTAYMAKAAFVGFSNDPTNTCEFASFKYFIEALVLANPFITVADDGSVSFVLDPANTNQKLFAKKKTGILLRSPHETISYLGKIVRQIYLGDDDGLLTIAAPNGKSVPIFSVNEGSGGGKAAISASVDGERYWIEKQSLRKIDSHYSFMAMGVIKDIISLNTSDSQLPSASTRLVVN